MNKFKKIYFLIVVKYKKDDISWLQDTLKITQHFFQNYEHFKKNINNFRLIVTQSNWNESERISNMEYLLELILDNN